VEFGVAAMYLYLYAQSSNKNLNTKRQAVAQVLSVNTIPDITNCGYIIMLSLFEAICLIIFVLKNIVKY